MRAKPTATTDPAHESSSTNGATTAKPETGKIPAATAPRRSFGNVRENDEDKKGAGEARTAASTTKVYMTSVSERLNKAVGQAEKDYKAKDIHRSPDLVELATEFDHMRRKLRAVIACAKTFIDMFARTEAAKAEMLRSMHQLSEGTPIFDDVGKSKNPTSLAHINETSAKKVKASAVEFQENVLHYATEWESIITRRVDLELLHCKRLAEEQAYHEAKVEHLRDELNKLERAGKNPAPTTMLDKLRRNEEKMDRTFKVHEAAASKACALLDQVVKQGWQDLLPLIKATVTWEKHHVHAESGAYAEMKEAVDRMSKVHNKKHVVKA